MIGPTFPVLCAPTVTSQRHFHIERRTTFHLDSRTVATYPIVDFTILGCGCIFDRTNFCPSFLLPRKRSTTQWTHKGVYNGGMSNFVKILELIKDFLARRLDLNQWMPKWTVWKGCLWGLEYSHSVHRCSGCKELLFSRALPQGKLFTVPTFIFLVSHGTNNWKNRINWIKCLTTVEIGMGIIAIDDSSGYFYFCSAYRLIKLCSTSEEILVPAK